MEVVEQVNPTKSVMIKKRAMVYACYFTYSNDRVCVSNQQWQVDFYRDMIRQVQLYRLIILKLNMFTLIIYVGGRQTN